MGRKKQNTFVSLMDAIESLEEVKGYSKEYIVESLKGALAKAYARTYLGNWDDANVKVDINEETGDITILVGKTVVASEEDIKDDFIEVALSSKEMEENGLNVGDTYYEKIPFEEIKKDEQKSYKYMNSFMTSFKARLIELERKALVETYGSMIGELINGTVERVNNISKDVYVNIGKTTVILEKKDQIGDETFKVEDPIKVVISNVDVGPKGAQIHISRSDPLFLRRLFEQEISEVYNGTVIIKDIARRPGERSKVAVYSNEPNIDPCGACIGQNGSRIQSITAYLGNGREKEKLDVVLYQENPELYIAEALVPGHVIGIATDKKIDEKTGREVNHAIAITRNGEISTTVGTKGVNVWLAYKLTGYHIDVMELDEALKNNVSFKTIEEIKANLEEEKVINSFAGVEATSENLEKDNVLLEDEVEVEAETPIVEEVKVHEEKPVEEEKVVTPIDVVKMDDLLSKLEEEKQQTSTKQSKDKKFTKKKVEVKDKEEAKPEENKKNIQGMAIYTDEELEELKRQEELEDEEESYGVDQDDDYDEYDSDEYYDN